MTELRAATFDDLDFLYDLRRAAMKTYVEQTWGWDEGWQQAYFRQNFTPATIQIIRSDGRDVGALSVEQRAGEVYVRSIEILPECQCRGIGTSILKEVLERAGQSGKVVALQVLKVNRARRLYERLGFAVVGETPTHFLMQAGGRGGI